MQIDYLIQYGYATIYEAEMNYSNDGYLYRFLMPKTHKFRDFGVDRFYENKAGLINRPEKNTQFLDSFYKGNKSHVDWLWLNMKKMNIINLSIYVHIRNLTH